MVSRRLKVIVAGGGIGGLTAAIALRHAGHKVTVYERSSLSHEIGQGERSFSTRALIPTERAETMLNEKGMTIGPNGGRILRHLGLDFDKARMINFVGRDDVSAETLELKVERRSAGVEKIFGVPIKTAYRVDLHRSLVDLARTDEGEGEPVEIITNVAVEGFDADQGIVLLITGERVAADLIIAADGVKSTAAAHLNGPECLDSSGTMVYRFTLSKEQVLSDPLTARLLDAGAGICTFYISDDADRWLVRYWCRDNGLQNFALYCLRTNEEADKQEHALRYQTDKATMLKEMEGFHPALLRLAEMTTDVLPLWRCTTREPLEHLHRRRMVVIGDAAHPVKPHLGMGAVSAIEDAAVLGTLFQTVPDSADLEGTISRRLQLFEKVRKGRLAAYKYYSDVPHFGNAVEEQRENCERWIEPDRLPASQADLLPWMFKFDAVREAERALNDAS